MDGKRQVELAPGTWLVRVAPDGVGLLVARIEGDEIWGGPTPGLPVAGLDAWLAEQDAQTARGIAELLAEED